MCVCVCAKISIFYLNIQVVSKFIGIKIPRQEIFDKISLKVLLKRLTLFCVLLPLVIARGELRDRQPFNRNV